MPPTSSRRPSGPVVVLSLLAMAGAAWWLLRARQSPDDLSLDHANVLLVTIDTLRADRVGPSLTPALDALARRGIRFDRAYTHAPMTLPAHASIFTGLTPPGHGARNNGAFRLDDARTTLAERLRDTGYRTGAFVGAFVLDSRFGLAQGFDVYDDLYPQSRNRQDFQYDERRAPDVLGAAADWILNGRAQPDAVLSAAGAADPAGTPPWFAWVHLFDPHAPYDAPARRVPHPYDNEVAYVDAELGRFLDRLTGAGQLARTLVVVTADHGEGLGDHGEATHGLFAYDTTLRVPLLVAAPGLAPGSSDVLAGHADLVPTILDLIGLEVPAGLHGRSLRGALANRPTDGAPIYFEAIDANLTRNWAPLTGLVDGVHKYVDLPIEELYDLSADPDERLNLTAQRQSEAVALRRRLGALRLQLVGEGGTALLVDPDTEARLRSLGYTAVTPAAQAGPYGEEDDPKRLVDLDRRFTEALAKAAAGDFDGAAALLRGVVEARPDFLAAYTSGASVLLQAGRARDAVALAERALANGLSTPQLLDRLGAAALAAGDAARAIAVLTPLAGAPGAPLETLNTLGVALAESGRLTEARRLFDRVLAADPRAAGTWNNVGLIELTARNPEAAATAFRRAVAADPTYGAAWQGLGAALVERDPQGAVQAWVRAVEIDPTDFDTLYNVGILLAQSDDPTQALPYLRQFVARAPAGRYRADIERLRRLIDALQER